MTQSTATDPERDLRALPDPADPRATAEAILFEVRRVIVGQDAMLERILVGLLSGGHLLLEGVPGLAKTLTIKTLAEVLGGTFKRIQFTPDLMPSDLVGTRIYRPDQGSFDVELGPVFANFLLADEINRAPAKVQSALLEVMQEHQVTIGHETHAVPTPFLVLATENPIEAEGTYPLPEAQVDRFMLKILLDYPSPADEAQVVARSLNGTTKPREIIDPEGLLRLQRSVADVYVDPRIISYAVALVEATRKLTYWGAPDLESYVSYGASPRGSINLVHGARALAVLRGRRYVLPSDVAELAPDVLRHRLVLSYAALADGITRRHDRRARPHPRAGAPPRHGGGADRMTAARDRAADLAHIGGRARTPARPGPGPIADRLVRQLELALDRRVGGQRSGDHLGLGRGNGLELDRIRPYEPGDDVRRIDWNATARTLVPQVREDVPDRQLTAWLLLDRSPSMHFGTADRRKADVAEGAALVVGRFAARRGNRLGIVSFGDGRSGSCPPAGGRRGMLGLLRTLASESPDESTTGSTSPARALALVGATRSPAGVVVVVSDFRGPRDWLGRLTEVAGRHAVIAVEVADPREDRARRRR